MTDILTQAQRSALMARIKGKGNAATELRMMAVFRACRITDWRRNSSLPGRPDFVFPVRKLAVFVDGCFWHGCPRLLAAIASCLLERSSNPLLPQPQSWSTSLHELQRGPCRTSGPVF